MRIEIFADQEWADRVAERWISRMTDNPNSRICLPTGETPRPVYVRATPDIDLSAATVFLLDEFDLPPGSAGRCDAMLQRDLLGSLAKAPGAFHRLDVDAAEADIECARFDALVANGGLNLTLLGLGTNGHLGLNEPGTAADSQTRAVPLTPTTIRAVERYEVGAQPVRGVTLGLRRILHSDEIWLLVPGSHKAEILAEMLNGPVTSDLPASHLRNHSDTTVFADRSGPCRFVTSWAASVLPSTLETTRRQHRWHIKHGLTASNKLPSDGVSKPVRGLHSPLTLGESLSQAVRRSV